MTPETLADILKVSKTLHDLIHAEVRIAEAEGRDPADLVLAAYHQVEFMAAMLRYGGVDTA